MLLCEVLVVELLRIVDDLPEVVVCGGAIRRCWTVRPLPPGGWLGCTARCRRRALVSILGLAGKLSLIYLIKVSDVTIAVAHGSVTLRTLRRVVGTQDVLGRGAGAIVVVRKVRLGDIPNFSGSSDSCWVAWAATEAFSPTAKSR